MGSAAANLASVMARIARACESVGRDPSSLTLVAVSKTRTAEEIKAFYDLGLRDFGESRLQEAEPKLEALPHDVRWHFIGKLQSNKARRVAELFQVVHTLESLGQLKEISKGSKTVDGLIEVNIAEEEQKSGVLVKTLDDYARAVLQCRTVRFRGLMTIGPAGSDSQATRNVFRKLSELNRRLGGEWLSMGMSEDFDVAIQEGSTHIRVGAALFGERPR
ncbi:MAG TPA: YggS family pyridoxal phosphate-dependent enzyme [Fimbriimonas sp.]|nr:YggS family pyridoxal phosphate-dependent enzyme [Fimbriimonas sp.]